MCDGVSNSVDSDVASLAAAKAVLDVLRQPLPKGLGVPESADAAVTKVFTDAAAAGNRAVLDTVPDDVPNPPSCTLVAAILEGTTVHYCGIGDSRVYLLPDAGGGQILTVDDSMAQVLIMGGTPRAEAEASKQAHSITKWLGKDSPDVTPRVGRVEVTGPGWLLACSDGLWNYASEPDAAPRPDRRRRIHGPARRRDRARRVRERRGWPGQHHRRARAVDASLAPAVMTPR